MENLKTILIVDDDHDLTYAIKRVFEKKDYKISQVFSLAECRNYLKNERPQLILLDVVLPDGSGVEMARELSENETLSTIGVLLMSGLKTDELDRRVGIGTGALDYVTKPLQMTNLLQRVNLIFSARNLEKRRLAMEEKYNNLFANVSDLVFVLDAKGHIQNLSSSFEQLTGYASINWVGKPFQQLISEADLSKWEYHFQLVIDNQIQPAFELHLRNKQQQLMPVLMVLSNVKRENDTEASLLGVAKDLTINKLMETDSDDSGSNQNATFQREINSWESLSGQATTITQNTYEVSAFGSKNEEIFISLLSDYSQLIEKAIETRIYKIEYASTTVRKEFANRLGFLKAGPRDLVRVHSGFFKQLDQNVHPKRLALYHEEARLALLEIMGYLVTYYRNRVLK